MCHFDKGRLRLLLSLETPNAVQPVASLSLNIQATSKCSYQAGQMLILIRAFAGRTYHIVGNLISWLISSFKGITVRLGTVSVGAIGLMHIRNKYGRTLVNPNFCSADTWS